MKQGLRLISLLFWNPHPSTTFWLSIFHSSNRLRSRKYSLSFIHLFIHPLISCHHATNMLNQALLGVRLCVLGNKTQEMRWIHRTYYWGWVQMFPAWSSERHFLDRPSRILTSDSIIALFAASPPSNSLQNHFLTPNYMTQYPLLLKKLYLNASSDQYHK